MTSAASTRVSCVRSFRKSESRSPGWPLVSSYALVIAMSWLVAIAVPTPTFAQSAAPLTHAAPIWELSPYVGVARHSPVTRLGLTPDRNHLFLGLHLTGTFVSWRRLSVAYSPEMVPLLLVSNTPTYTTTTEFQGSRPVQVKHITGRGVAAGFALSPLGLETQVRLTSALRVYGHAAAGAAWFRRDVPEPDSRAVNYTFEYGGGLQYRWRPAWALRAGYKFHHLSNAGSGATNPGLNGHVVTVGVARRLGHGHGR